MSYMKNSFMNKKYYITLSSRQKQFMKKDGGMRWKNNETSFVVVDF